MGLDILREGKSPDVGAAISIEVDPTHSRLGRISGAQEGRFLGDHFRKVSGTVAEARSEDGEGVDVGSEGLGDADAVAVGLLQSELQSREEPGRPRNRHGDKPEFPQDAFPVLVADAVSPS